MILPTIRISLSSQLNCIENILTDKAKICYHVVSKFSQVRAKGAIQWLRELTPMWQLKAFVTPVPEEQIPSAGLHRYDACMWYIDSM